ncbi:hypothetical protein N7508_001400 [Penicillium antarcticum]|uniref:uncharacterized protein n=1 Tax=Penicillium antarcticum TaxID=416450 RepID=UPI00238E2485|nr:uncharacterized protein N7508_001400 [Penicillium antarcticum]KAJ5316892.1 hypothetical protein N7508_001400 [Penicillium antarcticum]
MSQLHTVKDQGCTSMHCATKAPNLESLNQNCKPRHTGSKNTRKEKETEQVYTTRRSIPIRAPCESPASSDNYVNPVPYPTAHASLLDAVPRMGDDTADRET